MTAAKISCEWNCIETDDEAPSTRTGHSIVRIQNDIFLFGGLKTSNYNKSVDKYCNDLWKLSLSGTEVQWTRVAYSGYRPSGRESHSLVADADKILLFGGTNSVRKRRCLQETCHFTVGDTQYSCALLTTSGRSPEAVGFSANQLNKKVFVFGGILDGRTTNEFFMFYTEELSWIPLRSEGIRARCDHSSAVVGKFIYIYAGAASASEILNDLWRFDTDEMTWEEVVGKGSEPSPRAGHVLLAHRDKDLYFFGGCQNEENEQKVISSFYKFSLKNNKWKRAIVGGVTDITESIHGHVLLLIHSRIYFIGGIQSSGEVELSQIFYMRLINPSERKLIRDHFYEELNSNDDVMSTMDNSQIRLPQPVGNKEVEVMTMIGKFISSEQEHLRQQCCKATDELVTSPDHQACRRQMAAVIQRLENEKYAWCKLLQTQTSETQRIIDFHQENLEKKWKKHKVKLAAEKERIKNEWIKLSQEKEALTEERDKLNDRVLSLGEILDELPK